MNLKEIGRAEEWLQLAQGSDRWRAIRNKFINFSGFGATDLAYLVICTLNVTDDVGFKRLSY
jgi:hypothetical protein